MQRPRDLSKTRVLITKITKISCTSSNGFQQFLFQGGTVEILKHWKSEVLKQPLDTCLGTRKQSYLSTSLSELAIKNSFQRWSDPGFVIFF